MFTLADCDPAGWQMPISIGRKLEALADLRGDFAAQVVPVALTPEQVAEYGLPSTPLKASERRADRWVESMGVEQTELDALATLQPELLAELVTEAVDPFFDRDLDRRHRQAVQRWTEVAQARLDDHLGDDRLAVIAQQVAAQVEALEAVRLDVEVDGLEWPELELPDADVEYPDGHPAPLVDTRWPYLMATDALRARKAYENGSLS